MIMKWIAAAMLTLAVAVSSFELSCVASERSGNDSPAAAGPAYVDSSAPDLPTAHEVEERVPASMPALTR